MQWDKSTVPVAVTNMPVGVTSMRSGVLEDVLFQHSSPLWNWSAWSSSKHWKIQGNCVKCGKYIKAYFLWMVHTEWQEPFAHLIGHFFKAAPNEHCKHHSSHLESQQPTQKAFLDEFIRAIPVESCLFSDLCNEMTGKLVSNGCQRAKYLLSALYSKNSFMVTHLNIILKSKHGFAELFSLWLFSFLNDFKFHFKQRD